MRTLYLLIPALLLVACQAGNGYQYPIGPVPEPRLTEVTLNTEFRIRPDRASEIIQYGEIVSRRQLLEYYPHCIFELRTTSESARTVHPDTFTVTGIQRDRYMAWLGGAMLASAGGGDYNMVMSTTTISLHSPRQPEVFRLSCQQLDEPYHRHHVSATDMQDALGSRFTLR